MEGIHPSSLGASGRSKEPPKGRSAEERTERVGIHKSQGRGAGQDLHTQFMGDQTRKKKGRGGEVRGPAKTWKRPTSSREVHKAMDRSTKQRKIMRKKKKIPVNRPWVNRLRLGIKEVVKREKMGEIKCTGSRKKFTRR